MTVLIYADFNCRTARAKNAEPIFNAVARVAVSAADSTGTWQSPALLRPATLSGRPGQGPGGLRPARARGAPAPPAAAAHRRHRLSRHCYLVSTTEIDIK
jgi:hypothetical protein